MLNFIKAVLLGIIEGITEWLPISSTGHLILFNSFLPLDMSHSFVEMFDVVIQFGAILAVVVIYFKELWPFHRNHGGETFGEKYLSKRKTILWIKIFIALLPALVFGPLLDDYLDAHLYNAFVVALMLIIYGVLFIIIEEYNKRRKPRATSTKDITVLDAFIVGLFQCLAMVPGTSRSGATIIGGILIGLSRPVAAEFTFFLAIPTMLGASVLKIAKFGLNFSGSEIAILLTGCIVAFIVSIITIKFFMQYIRKHDFKAFGVYRIVLGIIVLILGGAGFLKLK